MTPEEELLNEPEVGRREEGYSVAKSMGVVSQLEQWNLRFANRLLRKEVWVDEDGNIVDPHEIPENERG